MKKTVLMILLALLLTGCKTTAEIKPDTIVDIPLHPTEMATTAVTEAITEEITIPAETESQPVDTEPATLEPTEKPTEKPAGENTGSGGKNNSGGKGPGKGSGNAKPPSQPPSTQPPTDPPTEPPTQPPTQPPTEAPTQPAAYDPAGYTPGSRDRAVADAVNAARREAGLAELSLDTRLCAIASVRAWEISRVWSHQRPDGSDGLSVLGEYGYGCGWAGENLYNGFRGAEQIVEKWMNSASDSRNILSENARVIGVGSYTAADGRVCIAAIFAG